MGPDGTMFSKYLLIIHLRKKISHPEEHMTDFFWADDVASNILEEHCPRGEDFVFYLTPVHLASSEGWHFFL
jgi:hypothetical protein